jgi:hypothetical protein
MPVYPGAQRTQLFVERIGFARNWLWLSTLRGVFAFDDLGSGVEAGFKGVGTGGGGLAFGGARIGGFLCVETVGGDLLGGAHLPGIADEGAGV